MDPFLEALRQNVTPNLWLVGATVWGLFYMRSKMRASQAESDERLSKQIHAGLTAWASNGGGQQIRLIVRDEIHQALGLHLDRDHVSKGG